MNSQTSITSLLFILLFILLPSSTAYFSQYVIPDCNFNNNTYTENSEYQHMLKDLLKRLNISTPGAGYSTAISYSVNRTNDVHGLAMCRGDLELPQGCSPCIQHAINEIGKLCPYMKNAAVFYDHCYLYYGNETFKGPDKMVGNHTLRYNINNITKVNREKFYKVREKLFSELFVEATNGTSSPKFFAIGEDSVSSDLSVFGLLQCIPDLATKQCKTCLDYHVKDLPEYAGFSAGFLSIGYSCFLRYENKLFYTKPTQPPSPPPEI
ncbi:hypothetical protein ZOSMA_2G02840 [Zostera marina]|uniref:Gnk2-homologous domain-containing protein n=1 Tax=Zostera marina TaxID=29655 RepID=A0A0K9PDG1_ZOSMR|nr:hypothetical protein ZOSMA_2G02840 [Zostera marina]